MALLQAGVLSERWCTALSILSNLDKLWPTEPLSLDTDPSLPLTLYNQWLHANANDVILYMDSSHCESDWFHHDGTTGRCFQRLLQASLSSGNSQVTLPPVPVTRRATLRSDNVLPRVVEIKAWCLLGCLVKMWLLHGLIFMLAWCIILTFLHRSQHTREMWKVPA